MPLMDHKHVLQFVHPREAEIMLMDHMNVCSMPLQTFSVQDDLSIVIRKAGNTPHQCCLTTSGFADHKIDPINKILAVIFKDSIFKFFCQVFYIQRVFYF